MDSANQAAGVHCNALFALNRHRGSSKPTLSVYPKNSLDVDGIAAEQAPVRRSGYAFKSASGTPQAARRRSGGTRDGIVG